MCLMVYFLFVVCWNYCSKAFGCVSWCQCEWIGTGEVISVCEMKACSWRSGTTPLILSLGTGLRWVVNVSARPSYLWERTPVPTEMKARWAPEQSGCFGEEKSLLTVPELKPLTVQPVYIRYTDWALSVPEINICDVFNDDVSRYIT
jgi:hypothetical protein